MSSGAKVLTHIAKETVPGETPASPDWQTLRFNENTLSPTPNVEQSDEITDSRIGQGGIITSLDITGDINAELSFGTFDELLAAAFYGEWDNDVLTIGDKLTSFSISKSYSDVAVYALFKGCHARTMRLEIPSAGRVMINFGFSCMDFDDSNTDSFVANPAPPTTTPHMSSLSVGSVKADGQSLEGVACVSAISFTIDNHFQEQPCLGSTKKGPEKIVETEAEITGSITLAWSSKAWEIWKEQLTRKTLSVEFPITDSLGNKYTFNLPAIEVDGELPSGGKRDLLEVTLNYTVSKIAPTVTREVAGP